MGLHRHSAPRRFGQQWTFNLSRRDMVISAFLAAGAATVGTVGAAYLWRRHRNQAELEDLTSLIQHGYATYLRQLDESLRRNVPIDTDQLANSAFVEPIDTLIARYDNRIPELRATVNQGIGPGSVIDPVKLLQQLIPYYERHGKYFDLGFGGREINGRFVARFLQVLLYDLVAFPERSFPDQPHLENAPRYIAVSHVRINPSTSGLDLREFTAWTRVVSGQRQIVVNMDMERVAAASVWERERTFQGIPNERLREEMGRAAATDNLSVYYPRLGALLGRKQFEELFQRSSTRDEFIALAIPQFVRISLAHELGHADALERDLIPEDLKDSSRRGTLHEVCGDVSALVNGGSLYEAMLQILILYSTTPGTGEPSESRILIDALIAELESHPKEYPSIDYDVPPGISSEHRSRFFISQFPNLTEAQLRSAAERVRDGLLDAIRSRRLN